MKSIYFWKNNLQADNEVILIIKTQHKLVAKLEEKLQEIHPYECPCLIYLPILGGSSAYLDWLKAETSS